MEDLDYNYLAFEEAIVNAEEELLHGTEKEKLIAREFLMAVDHQRFINNPTNL